MCSGRRFHRSYALVAQIIKAKLCFIKKQSPSLTTDREPGFELETFCGVCLWLTRICVCQRESSKRSQRSSLQEARNKGRRDRSKAEEEMTRELKNMVRISVQLSSCFLKRNIYSCIHLFIFDTFSCLCCEPCSGYRWWRDELSQTDLFDVFVGFAWEAEGGRNRLGSLRYLLPSSLSLGLQVTPVLYWPFSTAWYRLAMIWCDSFARLHLLFQIG